MNKTKLRHSSISPIEKSNSQKTKSSSSNKLSCFCLYGSKLCSLKIPCGSNYLKLSFSNNTHNTQIWQFTKHNLSDPRFPWNEAIHGFHFSFKAPDLRVRNDGMFLKSADTEHKWERSATTCNRLKINCRLDPWNVIQEICKERVKKSKMILSKDRAIALEAFTLDDRKDNNKSSSLKIRVNKEKGAFWSALSKCISF